MKDSNAYKLSVLHPQSNNWRLSSIVLLLSASLIYVLAQFGAYAEELDSTDSAEEAIPLEKVRVSDFDIAMKGIVDQSDQAILESLINAANSGSATAALALGNRYFQGTGVDKDMEAALLWWTKSSDLGSPSAAYNLGVAHLGDDGVAKNLAKAKAAFTKASRLGVVDAHLALGILGLHEAQSQEDFKQAGEYFRRAATTGSSAAAHNLSLLYEKGLGYPKDLEKAEYWRSFVPVQKNFKPSVPYKHLSTHSQSTEHIVHDSQWIVTRPAENYTLQLASGDTLKGTKKLISKITTLDCAIFKKIFAGKERFVAIAGDFLSYADALSAIEELPDSFSQNKPFIVNFKLLQRQIADHTKFNN